MPPDFHARYSAKGKTYCYYILNSRCRDPFAARYSWKIEQELDADKMNTFCSGLVGRHDFAAFSSAGRSVEDTVRTVSECTVTRSGDTVILKVTADGFLYNMVRTMVGTMLGAASGTLPPENITRSLETGDRSLVGKTMPARGLILRDVDYGFDLFGTAGR